jgi:putative transposase
MSTLSRQDAPNAAWHITSKVNWAAWHLKEEDAARTFFDCLLEALVRFGVDLIAYVLMSNHYHLVARSPDDALFAELTSRRTRCRHRRRWPLRHSKSTVIGQCMQGMKLAVARRIQSKLGVEGHFWDGRHHRRRLHDDWALVVAIAYDHRNPVRKNMVARPENYPRSSASWWARGEATPIPLCTRSDFPFGVDRSEFRNRLLRFQDEKRLDDVMEAFAKRGLPIDLPKGRAYLEDLMRRAGLNP